MPPHAAFYLGFQCLARYLFMDSWFIKGKRKLSCIYKGTYSCLKTRSIIIRKCRNPRAQINPGHQEKETQEQRHVLNVKIAISKQDFIISNCSNRNDARPATAHTTQQNKDKTRRILTQWEQHTTSLLCH